MRKQLTMSCMQAEARSTFDSAAHHHGWHTLAWRGGRLQPPAQPVPQPAFQPEACVRLQSAFQQRLQQAAMAQRGTQPLLPGLCARSAVQPAGLSKSLSCL